MARSPLTLAASVTSALPRVGVVGVGALTEGAAGRYDTAVADLDDGRRVVVRAPTDVAAGDELAAEVRALRTLTPGVRNLLPFRAPELLGEADLADVRVVVVDYLPGYRVDAAHLPPGFGAATSVGAALAALHALPTSVVRADGLPARTPQQVRTDAARVVDRAVATKRLPQALERRWRRAIAGDDLWRFESAVVLGGAGAGSFLYEDLEDVPTVTGLLDWHGLSVGDPAVDLQWLAAAPAAADDVFDAYASHSDRAPDAHTRDRSRLYAELEFAKWLVHGHEAGRDDIVADAVELLESLATGLAEDDLVADAAIGVDAAIALLDRMPDAAPPAVDTSMHTDTYDPEELSQWMADHEDEGRTDDSDDDEASQQNGLFEHRASADAPGGAARSEEPSTAPIPLPIPLTSAAGRATTSSPDVADADDAAEAERASEAALRRWMAD